MADEPETLEQYNTRRLALALARRAFGQLKPTPSEKLEGENDYEHMRIDVYARPKT